MQIKGIIRTLLKGVPGILLFLTLFSSFTHMHPYYISVTEVRINSAKKTMSLSCKMFTDDLQNALSKLYNSKADLGKRNAKCDSLINSYVKERLEISVGGKKAEFKYLGYEIEEEAAWCYFEANLPSDSRTVDVSSTILYDLLEAQTNFLHCFYDQEKQSYKLDNPKRTASFNFAVK